VNPVAPALCRKMNVEGNPMAWVYEICDSNNAVAETGKGFATHEAAVAAGRKRARELKASGSLPGGGLGAVLVTLRQDESESPKVPSGCAPSHR